MSGEPDAPSEESAFRNALAMAVAPRWMPEEYDPDDGDRLLAMPEMQAIKAMLSYSEERDCCRECHDVWLTEHSTLPAAVIAWVRS